MAAIISAEGKNMRLLLSQIKQLLQLLIKIVHPKDDNIRKILRFL